MQCNIERFLKSLTICCWHCYWCCCSCISTETLRHVVFAFLYTISLHYERRGVEGNANCSKRRKFTTAANQVTDRGLGGGRNGYNGQLWDVLLRRRYSCSLPKCTWRFLGTANRADGVLSERVGGRTNYQLAEKCHAERVTCLQYLIFDHPFDLSFLPSLQLL